MTCLSVSLSLCPSVRPCVRPSVCYVSLSANSSESIHPNTMKFTYNIALPLVSDHIYIRFWCVPYFLRYEWKCGPHKIQNFPCSMNEMIAECVNLAFVWTIWFHLSCISNLIGQLIFSCTSYRPIPLSPYSQWRGQGGDSWFLGHFCKSSKSEEKIK